VAKAPCPSGWVMSQRPIRVPTITKKSYYNSVREARSRKYAVTSPLERHRFFWPVLCMRPRIPQPPTPQKDAPPCAAISVPIV
jgi:hypothetical protein